MTTRLGSRSDDELTIERIAQSFFGLFTNRGGARPTLRAIFDLCIPEAVISKCVAETPEVFTLEAFIAPREILLTNGTLTEFCEVETGESTRIVGNVAQRVSMYVKSGVLDGTPFLTRGVKVFQFIRCRDGWRISAMAWDDERPGRTLE